MIISPLQRIYNLEKSGKFSVHYRKIIKPDLIPDDEHLIGFAKYSFDEMEWINDGKIEGRNGNKWFPKAMAALWVSTQESPIPGSINRGDIIVLTSSVKGLPATSQVLQSLSINVKKSLMILMSMSLIIDTGVIVRK